MSRIAQITSLSGRVVLAGLMIALITESAQAAGPKGFTIQGRITNTDGTPISDGDHSVQVKIYDVPTGGSPLWSSNEFTLTPVNDGRFTIALGTEVPIPDSVFLDDSTRYVGVNVDFGGEL